MKRDTPYAREIETAKDDLGQRIERLHVKEYDREEIRFSWWVNGKMMPRPLDLPEVELLELIREAIQQRVFNAEFLRGLAALLAENGYHA